MSVVFTQLASDSCQRANENPLSQGGNWSTFTTPLQIVNDQCIASELDADCRGFYTGISWPNDQWAQIEIASPVPYDAKVIVRSGYSFDLISGTLSPGNWSVVSGNVESFGLNSVLFLDYELKVGNVIRLAVQGTTFCVYLNGVLLGSAVDNDNYYSSGTPALDIFNPGVSLESAALVNFAGGSVSNATSNRFTFIEDQNSTSSAVLYDVVDSGDGKTVGQTFWDNVVAQAWSFNLRDNQPYIAAGSADAAEIQGFIATLAEPDVPVYDSTVPASTRFSFSAIVRRSGQPALQYLVSDGPSSAYGSAGQIIWDGVNDRF